MPTFSVAITFSGNFVPRAVDPGYLNSGTPCPGVWKLPRMWIAPLSAPSPAQPCLASRGQTWVFAANTLAAALQPRLVHAAWLDCLEGCQVFCLRAPARLKGCSLDGSHPAVLLSSTEHAA